MRWVWLIVLVLIVGLVTYQVFELRKKEDNLSKEKQTAEERLQGAIETRESLQAELGIFKDPELIEKELRRRYNYRLPDERMMVIIPENETSS
ncbi:MAG: hypothetical protein KGZ30_00375 [Anaplasmataceae bacterium]|nr:hypothetical protein [Anaplasmataceae bacterium]